MRTVYPQALVTEDPLAEPPLQCPDQGLEVSLVLWGLEDPYCRPLPRQGQVDAASRRPAVVELGKVCPQWRCPTESCHLATRDGGQPDQTSPPVYPADWIDQTSPPVYPVDWIDQSTSLPSGLDRPVHQSTQWTVTDVHLSVTHLGGHAHL